MIDFSSPFQIFFVTAGILSIPATLKKEEASFPYCRFLLAFLVWSFLPGLGMLAIVDYLELVDFGISVKKYLNIFSDYNLMFVLLPNTILINEMIKSVWTIFRSIGNVGI